MIEATDEKIKSNTSHITRLQEGRFQKGGLNPPPASPPAPPPPPPPQRPAQNKNDDGKK